jgi:hypothetical protein
MFDHRDTKSHQRHGKTSDAGNPDISPLDIGHEGRQPDGWYVEEACSNQFGFMCRFRNKQCVTRRVVAIARVKCLDTLTGNS